MNRPASAGNGPWRIGSASGSNGVSDADKSLPPSGSTLRRAFDALIATFNERGIRYAIIGGIATIQYTRVRTTDDIDALLTVPQIAMPGLFQALHHEGFTLDIAKAIRELRDDGFTAFHFQGVVIDLMRLVTPIHADILEKAQ